MYNYQCSLLTKIKITSFPYRLKYCKRTCLQHTIITRIMRKMKINFGKATLWSCILVSIRIQDSISRFYSFHLVSRKALFRFLNKTMSLSFYEFYERKKKEEKKRLMSEQYYFIYFDSTVIPSFAWNSSGLRNFIYFHWKIHYRNSSSILYLYVKA